MLTNYLEIDSIVQPIFNVVNLHKSKSNIHLEAVS